jgi:HSP20 family protein
MNTFLVRRNSHPLAQNYVINSAMNRMVRDAFGANWPTAWQRNSAAAAPALNIVESAAAFTVQAALPGWKPEQVDISFEKGVITLKGDIAAETETPDQPDAEKTHLREFQQEGFLRRFSLPVDVDVDNASAHFENGLLTLTLPKAAVIKPKQIKIEAKQ